MISVIIPTYNRSETLARAVDSVLSQTYQDIECIVVDDASTDCTEEVLRKYNDPRLRYKKLEKQQGACYARNCGVEMAKGEYIAFQDSDDRWLPDKLKRQFEHLAVTESDVVFCRMISKNTVTGRESLVPSDHFTDEEITIPRILAENVASTQTIMGKRDCFVKKPFDTALPRFQDWDLVIRLVMDYKVCYLPEVLVHAFVNSDSISSNPQKGVKGYLYLLDKWSTAYKQYPKSTAEIYSKLAICELQRGGDPGEYIKLQLKNDPSMKAWVKYIIFKLGLLKCYYKGRKVL